MPEPIDIGSVVEYNFAVSESEMALFIKLSGDRSSVHTDPRYARHRGFADVIVYGGIILAKLSYVLGSMLPGDHGVSTGWSIEYRKPLYVGEAATIRLQIVGASPSTGLVDAKFTLHTINGVLATGKTQSIVPTSEIADG